MAVRSTCRALFSFAGRWCQLRRMGWGAGALCCFAGTGAFRDPVWPGSTAASQSFSHHVAAQAPETDAKQADPRRERDLTLIRAQRICLAATSHFAGELSPTLAFRYRREKDQLIVGYFAHWSTERPWGDLPWTQSLVVDAVYSHLFFVLPGVRFLLYGPGDVEGALVTYTEDKGRLIPQSILADDAAHDPVQLRAEEFLDADGTIVLLSDVWSHQLGARNAVQRRSRVARRVCFSGSQLLELSQTTSDDFRLGDASQPRRAKPAWR